ncbi:MAG: dihydroxy-acid dehydratase [Ruthenibacterium lactatiformans]
MGDKGTIAILRGNLAPEGAVVKHSAVPVEMHKALFARPPFDCEGRHCRRHRPRHQARDAVFIRYEGPGGSGMPEMFIPRRRYPPTRAGQDYRSHYGRPFFRASKGPAIGHVSPEAAGGPPRW